MIFDFYYFSAVFYELQKITGWAWFVTYVVSTAILGFYLIWRKK